MSETVDLRDLKRKSVRGGVVTMATQGVGIGIQLTSTVVLGRLLSPEDYGIMAMVMAVTAFAGLFRDLGLSTAAIQRQELSPAQQTNLFWLNTGVGTLLTLGLLAASPWVAAFYGKPEVQSVTMLVAGNFLIGSLGTQGGVLLLRRMQFGRKAAAEIAGSLLGLVVSILLALRGLSYWSLAWGGVASALATTAALFLVSGFRPSLPLRGTGLKEMVKFGASIATYDFINYFHRNLDNVLIGRFCGPEPLGVYSRAYSLLMLPINSLRIPITSVAFPAISKLKYDPERFRIYYLKTVQIIALTTMPVTVLLFTINRPLVSFVLGSKWSGICPIFEILSIVAFIQPVLTSWGMLVQSRGLGGLYIKVGLFNTLFISIGFCIGLAWGTIGVATSYALSTYLIAVPSLIWSYQGTQIKIHDFLKAIKEPFYASISAGLASYSICNYINRQSENNLKLIVLSVITHAVIYILLILIMPKTRNALREIVFIKNEYFK